MAIRTTIVNKTKNADGTYSEKEIHPFTDMNAVVSLEAVSGNYDAYTSLPLEGAPQNALTAFLNTRSYLYSLRNFKNKTVTTNYTDSTAVDTKIPTLGALKNACTEAKTVSVPKSNITGEYNLQSPSTSKVLSQTGANNLFTTLNNAKIDRSDIVQGYGLETSSSTKVLSQYAANKLFTTLDRDKINKIDITGEYNPHPPFSPSTSKVLSQTGANDLYLKSFLNSLTLTILNAPIRYLSPIHFTDNLAGADTRQYVSKTHESKYLQLFEGEISGEPRVSTVDFFKLTIFIHYYPDDEEGIDRPGTLNGLLNNHEYNINDLYRGRFYFYPYDRYTGVSKLTQYYNNQIINPSRMLLPEIEEEIIIAIIHSYNKTPKAFVLYENQLADNTTNNEPLSFKNVQTYGDGDKKYVKLNFNIGSNAPNRPYTVEYCDMRIDNEFANFLYNHC